MSQTMRSMFLAAIIVPLMGAASIASAETIVKLGAAQPSAGSLPVIVADQKGLFAAEGLKYERLDFKGGAPAAQALAAGSIDACICAGDHAVHLEEKGLGGKFLVALADKHSYALLANGESPAKTLADLKGKKIGITSAGSLTDTTIRYAIKELGLDPDKDFQIIAVGRAGAQRAALAASVIDAGMFTTPDIQITMADQGKFKIVDDFRKMPYPAQDIVITDTWLKAHPEEAAKIRAAIVKAIDMINADKSVVVPAVKALFPKLTDEALINQIVDDVTSGYLSTDGVVTKDGFKNLIGVMTTANPKMKPVAYEAVVVGDLPK